MVMAKFICHKGDEHTLTKARNILFYLDTSYTWNVNEGMKDGAKKNCLWTRWILVGRTDEGVPQKRLNWVTNIDACGITLSPLHK